MTKRPELLIERLQQVKTLLGKLEDELREACAAIEQADEVALGLLCNALSGAIRELSRANGECQLRAMRNEVRCARRELAKAHKKRGAT